MEIDCAEDQHGMLAAADCGAKLSSSSTIQYNTVQLQISDMCHSQQLTDSQLSLLYEIRN